MKLIDLGLIDYQKALEIQLEYVEDIIKAKKEGSPFQECLIVCRHPSVVTLGRKSTKDDLVGWNGALYEISRGGKATYHGPGQIVIYPIIDLTLRNNDIHLFLRSLEKSMVRVLESYGLNCFGDEQNTGVWLKTNGQTRKIASIGIALKHWVSYHGLAINLFEDELAFQGINPCGFEKDVMCSLEEIIGHHFDYDDFKNKLIKELDICLLNLKKSYH